MSKPESYELQTHAELAEDSSQPKTQQNTTIRRLNTQNTSANDGDIANAAYLEEDGASVPEDDSGVEVEERWNESKGNVYRTFATFWALLVMGMNDAAYGVSGGVCLLCIFGRWHGGG